MGALRPLSAETEATLRGRFHSSEDEGSVLRMAARQGWLEANRAYLAAMRGRGTDEMTALMEAAGVASPAALDDAVQLLETALSLWSSGTMVKRLACRKGSVVLEIRVVDCPIYARLQQSGWHGVTACGNWHRRRGWYDALGLMAEDTLLREKKWGYGACVARVHLLEAHRLH